MNDVVWCPRCQRRLQLPEACVGVLVQCPGCRTSFRAEADPAAAAAVTPAAGAPEHDPHERRQQAADWPPRPIRAPAAPASGGHAGLATVGVIGGIVAFFGVALVVLAVLLGRSNTMPPPPRPRPVPVDEVAELEAQRQFWPVIQPPIVLEQVPGELAPFFEDVGAARRAGDLRRAFNRYDFDRMLDELKDVTNGPVIDASARRAFVRSAREAVIQRGAQAWLDFHVQNVKKIGDDEIVVVSRHKHVNGGLMKLRWWFTRRSGEWKVYDLEFLDQGQRTSTLMAVLLADHVGDPIAVNVALNALWQAVSAIQGGDADGADKFLAEMGAARLPDRLESQRHLVKGWIHLHRDQRREALRSFDEARRLRPDTPLLDRLEANAHVHLGEWDKGLKCLEAYRDLAGEDPSLCRDLGYALRGLGRFPEAAVNYRKALDLEPQDLEGFRGLLHCLGGDDNADDLGIRFTRLGQLPENFEVCAEDCEQREFPELLKPLIAAMRRVAPKHPSLDYYEALIKARSQQTEQAIPLFKAALARQPDPARQRSYLQHFFKAMVAAGKIAEAYAAAPEPVEAFRFLAREAATHYRMDELRLLVLAHRKDHADDSLLPFYQAELHVQNGNYRLADRTFRAALAHPPDDPTLQQFRASRVLARYHAGEVLAAYRTIGPRDETFLQLASLCCDNHDVAQLQLLLDVHGEKDPENSEVLRFRYRLKLVQREFAEGIALFKASLARLASPEKREERVDEFLADMVSLDEPLEGYKAAPDALHAFQTLAAELEDRGRWGELRGLIAAHRARHADDPWLIAYESQILVQKQEWDKAARLLAASMKQAPKEVVASLRWRYYRAAYKAGRGMEAYENASDKAEAFQVLAGYFLGDKKAADAEALIAAHRPNAGDNPELFLCQAQAKILLKQVPAANALFLKAYQKQTNEKLRPHVQNRYLTAMAGAGFASEGYETAPDKTAAFDVLAGWLLGQKQEKHLAALLETHGRDHAADPLHALYQGERLLLLGQFDKADDALTGAVARAPADSVWRYRNAFHQARVKAGKAARTFRESDRKVATFESLAYLCMAHKDSQQLEVLVATLRAVSPDNPALPIWDVEVHWLKHDYERVLATIAAHEEDVFVAHFRWRANDYQVRSLVRLKRIQEAIATAKAGVNPSWGNVLLLVLAHAASGDVKQTLAVLGKELDDHYLKSFYQDPDLGPLLKTPAFREFREKHPEPERAEE